MLHIEIDAVRASVWRNNAIKKAEDELTESRYSLIALATSCTIAANVNASASVDW